MKLFIRWITLAGVGLLSGCMLDKGSMTADERMDQESRMQRFLNDSSPRNMNQEPKVTPELSHRFVIPKDSSKVSKQQKSSEKTKPITEVDIISENRD